MELSELTAYAREKYQMEEQHKWADFPGFSVLTHPRTGKWVALLMRQWDTDTGTEIQRCDLKCGAPRRHARPYLTAPIRMRGSAWVGVAFGEETEPAVVLPLLDQAVAAGEPRGFTIVLPSRLSPEESPYRDTALPFAGSGYRPPREELPERLREMRRLYEYGRESAEERARNFYRQAVFMADYEDDVEWAGEFVHYFPTYHDLSTRQLRGYFTWRARLRRGDVRPIPTSAAYLYVYELLNGVGAADPADALSRLGEFQRLYLDAGIGDPRMKSNLRRWMLDLAVLRDLPPETARAWADPAMMARDDALGVLRSPEEHADEEVFAALCLLGGKKPASSPVLTRDPARGMVLFAGCWRESLAYRWQDRDLFSLCFGERTARPWYPLANAVYYERSRPADREYVLNECRRYRCRGGLWQVEAYELRQMDKARLQGFLHQADARLRRCLKTGRYLREDPADAWADPFIEAAIRAEQEASRPRLTIDLSGRARIGADAALTRDSLLVEEEPEAPDVPAAPPPAEEPDLPLDRVEVQVLRALLAGQDPGPLLREARRMPSLMADAVNEALMDDFGDTVVLCEGDALLLVDDYTEDLERYLEGEDHGGA